MVTLFDNDDAGYLSWIASFPNGFVINIDRAELLPQYPMVHAASHRAISSPSIGNFTTGDYVKYCCDDLAELKSFAMDHFRMPLTRCLQCMRTD